MAKVRVSEAVGEGVRLIRRDPVATLAWSGIYFLTMALPAILMFSRMGPMFANIGQTPTDAQALSAISGMFAMMPLTWLGYLVGNTLIGGAVLRAVLYPEDRKYFYLRIGARELWMILSAVVGIVLAYIAFIVAIIVVMIPVGILIGVSSSGGGGAAMVLASLLPFLILLVFLPLSLFFILRFALAPIMSFDEKKFRLFESWGLTRGEGWRLLGVGMLLFLLVVVLDIIFISIVFAVIGPSLFAGIGDPAQAAQLPARMMSFYSSPFMIVVFVILSAFAGPMLTIFIAPWARVYLMLKDNPADVFSDAAAPQGDGKIVTA